MWNILTFLDDILFCLIARFFFILLWLLLIDSKQNRGGCGVVTQSNSTKYTCLLYYIPFLRKIVCYFIHNVVNIVLRVKVFIKKHTQVFDLTYSLQITVINFTFGLIVFITFNLCLKSKMIQYFLIILTPTALIHPVENIFQMSLSIKFTM